MGSQIGVATRLARAALIKAGLTEDEADKLIERIKADHSAGQGSTLEERLATIEDWTKAQPSGRQSFIVGIVSGLCVAELQGPFNKLLVDSYDDVISVARSIEKEISAKDPSTLSMHDKTNLVMLGLYTKDQNALQNSSTSKSLLAAALDHFSYYTYGEFLHRKALEHWLGIFQCDHMTLGPIRLSLVVNLYKQGRKSEADRECHIAVNSVKYGDDFGQKYDYKLQIETFSGLFEFVPHNYVCSVLNATVKRIATIKPPSDPAIIKGRALLSKYCRAP